MRTLIRERKLGRWKIYTKNIRIYSDSTEKRNVARNKLLLRVAQFGCSFDQDVVNILAARMQHISGQSQHRWVEYTIFANNFNAALITVLVLGADSGASGPAPWLRLGLRRLWWCSGGFCNNDLEFNCIRMPLRTLTLQASPPLDSWIESPSSRLGKFQQNCML